MVNNKQNRDWMGIDGKVRLSLVESFFCVLSPTGCLGCRDCGEAVAGLNLRFCQGNKNTEV